MRRRTIARLFSIGLAMTAVLMIVTAGSAGRAWCRADPVLIVDGDVVDIQVSSSPAMYSAATGPIEMVVNIKRGTRANVLLQDFGFGHGYKTTVVEADNLPRNVVARVEVYAPANDGSLPVTVHGTRVGTSLARLFSRGLALLWLDDASGNANEWIVLDVR